MVCHPLSLNAYFNNDGISYSARFADGDFDGSGNTYPAEDLPVSNRLVELRDASVLFPDKRDGAVNNIALEGQEIDVSPQRYHRLVVIGASDSGRYAGGGYIEPVHFLYRGDREEVAELGLKDWNCIPQQRQGGKEALRCSLMHTPQGKCLRSDRGYETRPTLWFVNIELDPTRVLERIALPDNPCMHVFALTLSVGQ